MKEWESPLEYGSTFRPSIPILECEIYTQYTSIVGSVDQFQRNIVQYEACRKEQNSLFTAN